MKILLRDAVPSDFDTIARISIDAYSEYTTKLTAENWQIMKRSINNVSQTAVTAEFIVAEIDCEIVGAIAPLFCWKV